MRELELLHTNLDTTSVNYHFVNNELAKGIYTCIEEYSNEREFINIFNELYDLLKDKYGKPTQKETVSDLNEMYQTGIYGTAVWNGEKAGVDLSLSFQQGGMLLQVLYEHHELNQELIDSFKDQTSDKL